jgi:hypothetical protein
MLREIGVCQLSPEPDTISWALEPSGKFFVRSLYKNFVLDLPGDTIEIWRVSVPMKIRVFLLQLVRKRLPSNDNIQKRRDLPMVFALCVGRWKRTTTSRWKTTTTSSLVPRWRASCGAWSETYLVVLGTPRALPTFFGLCTSTLAKLGEFFGWRAPPFFGRFGILGTNSPLRACFRLTRLTVCTE